MARGIDLLVCRLWTTLISLVVPVRLAACSEESSVLKRLPEETADATDPNLTGSMFAAFASADGSTAVKTAAALAVICKLATERLWPATSTDGVPHGGMRKLDGFLLLPIRQRIHPASPSPQQQKSQQPPTPPAPQKTEDSMLGKHPRDDLSLTRTTATRTTATRAELGRPCSPQSRRRAR